MITQERLKELLHYDPKKGAFTWKVRAAIRIRVGDEAGNVIQSKRTKYKQICIAGTTYYAHRLAWLYIHGQFPKHQIDHIDGNGLNNRIKNLRDVTSRENRKNSRLISGTKSGIIGVSFDKSTGKWHAYINIDSGREHLGLFNEIEDAASVRKAAEIKYGYHENHGRS